MENELTTYLEDLYPEVSPRNFYRGIFPAGSLDKEGAFTQYRYTGIVIEVTGEKNVFGHQRIKRYSLTDELGAVDVATSTNHFCICSPLSYAGKERTAEHAREAFAIAIDLDHIRMEHSGRYDLPIGIVDLFHQFDIKHLPRPTYIVSSGTGLHLYYVLENPVPLFRNYADELQDLKRALTKLIWNDYIVNIKSEHDIQQEGIYQGFRMPGTVTKRGDRARAFLTGERVSIADLNQFVPDMYKAKKVEKIRRGKISFAEAEKLYPEWSERVKQGKRRGQGTAPRRVYEWWKRKIFDEAKEGHRYYCLMILAIYAKKCSIYDEKKNPNPVTREELEDDCFALIERMERLTTREDNHFTEDDVLSALEAFNDRWITYPRAAMEYRSGIANPPNKRNGQRQADHLEEARAIRDIRSRRRGEAWDAHNGRKPKRDDVLAWRRDHPDGKKIECFRETGLSRVTIDKYWNETEKQ